MPHTFDVVLAGCTTAAAMVPALVPAEWAFSMAAGASLSTFPPQWRWLPATFHTGKCMLALVIAGLFAAVSLFIICYSHYGTDCKMAGCGCRGSVPLSHPLVACWLATTCAAPMWVHLALVWYRRSNDNGLAVAMGPSALLALTGDRAALGAALITFCAYFVPAKSPLRARVQIGLVTAAAVAFLGLRSAFDDLSPATAGTVALVWLPLVAVLGRR